MIVSAKEALESKLARLTDREQHRFQFVLSQITAAIRDNFNGRPSKIPIPLNDVSERIIYAVKRRFEKPAEDGSRWIVSIAEGRDASGALIAVEMTFEPAPPCDVVVKPLVEQAAARPTGSTLGALVE